MFNRSTRTKDMLSSSGLPVSVTSSLCQTAKTMHYLQDWSGECSHSVLEVASSIEACENDPGLSAVSFYSGFTILSAPQLLNHSHFKEVIYFILFKPLHLILKGIRYFETCYICY